jgi:hypothetical protein
MKTISERAIAIATALADFSDLPHRSLIVGYGAVIGMPTFYGSGFGGVREVAAWAQRFNTELIVSLSSGEGKVQTDVVLGGEPVSIDVSFGTAQAYELGRILQRELNPDVSIHISADELLAAIDQTVQS